MRVTAIGEADPAQVIHSDEEQWPLK
jgi:hypothetical protein